MKTVNAAILSLLMTFPLLGQSTSKRLDRIAREQQNIRQRLENINKKMDRLARKNDVEGKEHTADLIRRARAELEKREVVKRIESLDARIRASQLTVGEEQAELLRDLEDIFAILQDRTDMERIKDILATYAESLERVGALLHEQDEILTETRELIYEESALRESNRERLDEILEGQKELNQRVDESAQRTASEEAWWELAESLDRLALEQEGLLDEMSARLESGERNAEGLSERQAALEEKLDQALEQARTLSGEEKAPKQKEALAAARESLERSKAGQEEARRNLDGERLESGREQAAEALEQLHDASQELAKAGKASRRERLMESRDMAGSQDFLEQKMEELVRKMEALDSMTSGEKGEESKKGEEILEEMKEAEQQLSDGDPSGAEPPQEKALEKLEQLREMMRNAESSQPSKNLSQPERQQKLKDLAQRQKELEEQTRDLMRRMRELPDKKPVSELSNAADNMSGASSELSQGEGEEAEVDEEEAKKYLERAQQEMVQQENKYQNIRQQEVLFRVLQALEELKTEQDEVNTLTAQFDAERGQAGRITRLQRKTLRNIAQRELDVRNRTDDVKQKVQEDEATVFSWVLERNVEDLDEIVESLNQRDSGPLVQTVQVDVSERFSELIEAMKMELKRRSEAPSEESGGQQPQGNPPQRNPLIPPVAELLMIKKMEENALRRINDFMRLHPGLMEKGAGPMEAQMLERLGRRHVAITELFGKMLERAGGDAAAPETEEGR
jgi:hypothetical protein